MERRAYNALKVWKKCCDRKPLILDGARQVGKTWLLKEFGRREYKAVVYFSMDKSEDAKRVFEQDYDVERILRQLSALAGADIKPSDTLLILDEVQECPRAVAALKYFCEDAPQYHVAVAGSLLGIALHKGLSFPVGKVQSLRLYPMNFEEFLGAMGQERLATLLAERDYEAMNTLLAAFTDLLRQYFYVGGMPAAVLAYAGGRGLTEVRRVQKQILSDYENDFSKHAPLREVARINMVWQSIPAQLFRENKKFRYADIKKGGRATEFEVAIQWLVDTGLVYKVHRCKAPHLPLKAYEDFSAFKLYLSDLGLLGAMVDAPAAGILVDNGIFSEYKGGFAEQHVLQQLKSHSDIPVYYYSADDSRMEIDFLLQVDDAVVPVEVKAGRNIRSNSLSRYLHDHPSLRAIRYSLLPYRHQENLDCVPLFAVV